MNETVKNDKQVIEERYRQITELYSNPLELSKALEREEARVSIIDGAWAWDVVIKYFPLANKDNWMEYYKIVKEAVKLCQERGVQIGIVPMAGIVTQREKEWLKQGFWWRVQKFPKIGRLTKTDAKMLQEHRYSIIGGIANGGINVLKSAGYTDEEAKKLFLTHSVEKLDTLHLLPQSLKKLDYKK